MLDAHQVIGLFNLVTHVALGLCGEQEATSNNGE
jgi:hypothetical protein